MPLGRQQHMGFWREKLICSPSLESCCCFRGRCICLAADQDVSNVDLVPCCRVFRQLLWIKGCQVNQADQGGQL